MTAYLLAIDQGTTNSRAIIFTRDGQVVSQHEISLKQSFPADGWVEQNPIEMFENSVTCCKQALEKAQLKADQIAAIGITNQRETTIIWDKVTGKPIYPAIVWQDRRTSALCKKLEKTPLAMLVYEKTGLLLDPYFSATKIVWILENVPGARERAEKRELLFGTVDTFLLWKLTNGGSHATDATNASRTLLFDIHEQAWNKALLAHFDIPAAMLPVVLDNAADFGSVDESILGAKIPITGMAGDQQAATIGQACFTKGMVKATFGTGCFMLLNTGNTVVQSKNQLLSTVAYRLNGKVTYGLEGSIFCAGVTIKWLRDTIQLITSAQETEKLARSIESTEGVYLVPAFTGLGAPYWDAEARGAILGLTRNSGRAHIARAALESVAYQACDLLSAMHKDAQTKIKTIRVDGGMIANNWLLQYLADMLRIEVQRPTCIETTALGAAYLAGLQIGVYQSLDEIAALWRQDQLAAPMMPVSTRNKLYKSWQMAAHRVLTAKG